jgi:hypothetical protein
MTPAPSFQTVALKRGKHADPRHGVCVMELVSMIAGEPFSDRPATACPVIAGFLRAYNDRCGKGRRQDLFALAALAVETRADRATERVRLRRLLARADGMRRWPRRELRVPDRLDGLAIDRLTARAAHTFARRRAAGHEAALQLVCDLAAVTPVAPCTEADAPARRRTGSAPAPHGV